MGGCRCQLHVCPSVTSHHAVGMLMTQEGCVHLVTVTRALGIMPFLCHFTAIHEMFVRKMYLDLCPSYPNVPQGHGSCPLFPSVMCFLEDSCFGAMDTTQRALCFRKTPRVICLPSWPARARRCWLSAVLMVTCSSHMWSWAWATAEQGGSAPGPATSQLSGGGCEASLLGALHLAAGLRAWPGCVHGWCCWASSAHRPRSRVPVTSLVPALCSHWLEGLLGVWELTQRL